MTADVNVDRAEIEKFEALAHRWWDPDGDFKPLHDINAVRVAYLAERCTLAGARVADIGCGGGILTESLATLGAHVTGIDMAESPWPWRNFTPSNPGSTGTSVTSGPRRRPSRSKRPARSPW